MNAGGVPNTCKSSGSYAVLVLHNFSGGRVSNTWATCPIHRNNNEKLLLMPDKLTLPHGRVRKDLSV
jgi:hypothetical protein